MNTPPEAAVEGSPEAVVRDAQPTALAKTGQWLRGNRLWVFCAVAFVVISLVGVLVAGNSTSNSGSLSISNPAPAGAQAVASILRHQGVTVTATDSLASTRTALAANGSGRSTVLFQDPNNLLTPDQVAQLVAAVRDAGGMLVAVTPAPLATSALGTEFNSAGSPAGTGSVQARCNFSGAVAAGTVDGGAPASGALSPVSPSLRLYQGPTVCFAPSPTGDDSAGFLALNTVDASDRVGVALVGNPGWLMNQNLASRGNAALALGLLGSAPELLWYTASVADIPVAEQPPSLAAFTPAWVFPASAWLLLIAVVGMLWRGRRNGPLVTEPLPVIVKASETLTGRARLYQDARATNTAGQTLQRASLTRLALKLRLGHSAGPSAVVDATAQATGRNRQQLHALLVTSVPKSDKELMTMAAFLAALEEEVARP